MAEVRSPFPEWQEHKIGDHVRLHYVGGEHVIWIREVMEPGGAGPRHRHDKAEELMFVTDGELTVTIGEETRNLHAGDVAIVPKSVEHELYTNGGGTYYLLFSPGNGRLPTDDFILIEQAAS